MIEIIGTLVVLVVAMIALIILGSYLGK